MADLARYLALVDEPEAFLACASRPLPRVVWVNTVLTSVAAMQTVLDQRAPTAAPVPGLPGAWRLPADAKPGKWPEFHLGLLHAQEEVALWPVHVLDPQPGERVLDLCAAPGNKAVRIAVAMGDNGQVWANDSHSRRVDAVSQLAVRLGLTSLVVTVADGATLADNERFDRVLVDAPCSCEGTTRKRLRRREAERPDDWHGMAVQQSALLQRAVELTRPGGVIVYSTCTYAPEENEGVLDRLNPEQVRIEPTHAAIAARAEPGIQQWRGRRFRADVVNSARFWPHHNDTGGFFVARLHRL